MPIETTDGVPNDLLAANSAAPPRRRKPRRKPPKDGAAEKISMWEIAGVPVVSVLYAAYRLHWLEPLGVQEDQLPDLMFVGYFAAAIVRALGPRALAYLLEWRKG
jgi:hypothetical protein